MSTLHEIESGRLAELMVVACDAIKEFLEEYIGGDLKIVLLVEDGDGPGSGTGAALSNMDDGDMVAALREAADEVERRGQGSGIERSG